LTVAAASREVMNTDTDLARLTMRQANTRLVPLLVLLFICNYLDRTNVAIAALEMNRDLHFSNSAYGFGAGIFFIGYALFEVPSNLILARVGARRWIARIMISWGLIASATMFVRTPAQFYALRILLGVAEAGFFPGIVYYLSDWFPAAQRGRVLSRFLTALPLAGIIGNPLGGWLLGLDGWRGLTGWQWLFLLEGIPSVLLGAVVLRILPDKPADAGWLSIEQKDWLTTRLARDAAESRAPHGVPPLRALILPMIWVVSLGSFLANTTNYGYSFWAPTLIRDALHLTNAATGLVTGAIACVAMVVMVAVGAHSDRTGERNAHAAVCMMLAALGCVGTALLPGALARVASLALVPIGVYAFYGPFWCLPPSLLRGTAAAAGIAFVNSIGNLGGFAGPYVLGVLRDATGGITGSFLVLSAVATAGAVLCLALRRRDVRVS
jgi:MFS transporter, ACS family, tartrate transporter